MAAHAIDPAALSPEERRELDELLAAPRILAEPESRLAVVWILLAIAGVAALAALLFWARLGVVPPPWVYHGPLIAVPYALTVATILISLFKAITSIRMQRLPWKPGRYLLAQGFLDTRRRPIRYLPITDFTRVEIHEGESHNTELRFFTISVFFGEVVEKFHLFGRPESLPRAALDELPALRETALIAQRSEGGYRFSRRASPAAPLAQARSRVRVAEHPWKVAGALGVVALAPLYLFILPALSLGAAEHENTVWAHRVVERAYPYGWVKARTRPAIHARFEEARARLESGVAAEHRAPLLRLLAYLEAHDDNVAKVRLVLPAVAQADAATRLLEASIKDDPGATAAPVVLLYQYSIGGDRAGQEELSRALRLGLQRFVPEDILDLQQDLSSGDTPPSDPEVPRIEVASSIQLTSVFQGQTTRRYAALDFAYEASLVLPGEPKTLLVPWIHIPPPANLSVTRFSLGNDKQKPLGGSGDPLLDRVDDSTVYTHQASMAAEKAGKLLAEALLAP